MWSLEVMPVTVSLFFLHIYKCIFISTYIIFIEHQQIKIQISTPLSLLIQWSSHLQSAMMMKALSHIQHLAIVKQFCTIQSFGDLKPSLGGCPSSESLSQQWHSVHRMPVAAPLVLSIIWRFHPLSNLQLLQSVLVHLFLGQDEADDSWGEAYDPGGESRLYFTQRGNTCGIHARCRKTGKTLLWGWANRVGCTMSLTHAWKANSN